MYELGEAMPARYEGGMSYENTVLAFRLDDWQVKLLNENVSRLSKRKLKVFTTEHFTDIYAVPHFIGFLNFATVKVGDREGFLGYLRECSQPPLVIDGEKFDSCPPLTYILNCEASGEKMPNLIVNSDIFARPDTLRLALLQEIKNTEGAGQACENSIRLRRVLKFYQRLVYRKEITKRGLLGLKEQVSLRMIQLDMAVIREVDPNVRYDPAEKRYVLHQGSGQSGVESLPGRAVSRLQRILMIYRQLVYQGWITKHAVDKMGKPVSLRMFQRDMRIICKEVDPNVKYDKVGKKYVLQKP